MRLTNVKGDPQKQMQLFAEADKRATLGKYQLAIGSWQHPRTGLWQVWMSTAGSDISWLAAFRNKTQAEEAVETCKQFFTTDAIYDPEKVRTFFQQLAESQDAEPQTASAAEVATITKQIREMVFDIHGGEEQGQ